MRSQSSSSASPSDTDASASGAPESRAGDLRLAPGQVTCGASMGAGQLGPLGCVSEDPWEGGVGDSHFYRELRNRTAEVSVAAGPHGEVLDGGWKGVGDFYGMPEDPYRGVSMAPNTLGVGSGDIYGSFAFAEPDELLTSSPVGKAFLSGFDNGNSMDNIYQPGLDFQDPLAKSFESGIQGKYNILNSTAHFPETQRPPPLPTDAFFALEEATTLHLSLSRKFEPSKIGNDLLDFLEDSVAAAILKVNPVKFTVKANIFIESRMCTIKARIYHASGSKYALEMQRRSGDAVVFNTTFQKAAKYFDECLYFGSTPPAAAIASAALAKPTVPPADMMDFQPMLDMADMEELPSLQAEVAAALAEFVAFQPSAASAFFCCQEAFDRIRRLLQSGKQDVAYPTAQLLSQLAKMSEAGPFVTEDSFVQLIVEKVCSKQSSLPVRTELTKLVSTMVQQHAGRLSSRAKDSITAALAKATGPGPLNSKLRPSATAFFGGLGSGTVF